MIDLIPVGNFIDRRCTGFKIKVNQEVKFIKNLKTLGNLMKHIEIKKDILNCKISIFFFKF